MQTPHDIRRSGALIAIGGNEDRTGDKAVLRAALGTLSVAGAPSVAVLTAASAEPGRMWETYRPAFEALGARPAWLDIRSRADAEAAPQMERLARVDLVFMTGGDQERLARLLHGTASHRLLLRRQRDDGLAIAGTSAGASVLGTLMPGGSASEDSPRVLDLSDAPIPRGLGFVAGVVIDQHFTQRRRLARLMDLSSRQGGLVGLGIDEDTAAIIRPGVAMTVVGSGSVTLIDCRHAHARGSQAPVVSLRQVSLHRGRAGAVFPARPGGDGRQMANLLP